MSLNDSNAVRLHLDLDFFKFMLDTVVAYPYKREQIGDALLVGK